MKKLTTKIKFSREQAIEILIGYEHGLTEQQIALYAKPEFSWEQMAQIRFGLENGLTDQQVSTLAEYAKEGFEWEQLEKRLKKLSNKPEIVELKSGDLVSEQVGEK